MRSIVDCLESWAERDPNRRLSTFLDIDGNETASYTYLGFRDRTSQLAAYLASELGMKKGDRALLVYPPGLEISAAFVACARIGVLPVPVYPPTSADGLNKLRYIVDDCQPAIVLTTTALRALHHARVREKLGPSPSDDPLDALVWASTDDIDGACSGSLVDAPGSALFLQYTSGSTSQPKGVIVSHENVIHNARATTDHRAIGVSWLPQYHDMGLIGYYLFPLVVGATTYGFSPLDFLRRPLLWLETMSRVRATYASGPNFAFEYCLREDKVPADQLGDLDLGSLRVLMNASEPARASTHARFLERFSPHGLRPEALVVAYGLAEHTLAATHYGRRTLTVNRSALGRGSVRIEVPQPGADTQQQLLSCGRPLAGVGMQIVDPKTRAPLPDAEIGEVWLAGQSVCQGYWNKPALTREVFQNQLGDDPHVRTGDLGFRYDGELFICGRRKDLIIIRGVNHHPQDIEAVVEATSPKLKPGGVVAFEGGQPPSTTGLVVVAEVRNSNDLPDPADVVRGIRTLCKVEPSTIAFVRAREIVRTTSGKLARQATRQRWQQGELSVIATYCAARDQRQTAASSPKQRIVELFESLGLAGDQACTLAQAGLDSLERVTLVADVEAVLAAHGASELAGEVDIQALERLRAASLVALLERLETAPDEALDGFRRALSVAKSERTRSERLRMQTDAELGFDARIEAAADRRNLANGPSDILLTGATGFFGPFLLHSLLQRTEHVYTVLIRADAVEHGMQRIREALQHSRLWTPNLDAALQRRVRVICGDIARPKFGLTARAWATLAARVQGVVHNAAQVNYVRGYEELRATNVEGTRELLRLAFAGAQKEFHLISSTIIHGWTNKEILFESDANPEMNELDFGYAQTKWVAEQLVFAAGARGLTTRIYRPSFISASSRGVASRDDIIVRLLAFMINHGIAAQTRNQISFIPADVAADAIASIFAANFRATPTADQVLHVTANHYYNMEDVTRSISERHGQEFAYHDIPSFVAEMRRRATPDDLVYPLLDFFSRACPKIVAMQNKRYGNARFQAAREACGGPDEPSLQATVSYLTDFLVRENLVRFEP